MVNWFIDNNGSNDNSGLSIDNPLLTLAKALEYSSNGDTIQASAGTYQGDIITKEITLLGPANFDSITIQSNNVSLTNITSANVDTSVGFWTGINISSCTITQLTLNGTFVVNSNTIGSCIVYSCRSGSITNNTFSGTQNIIHITKNNSYSDRENSKGGVLTISGNTATCSIFIYIDYFNNYTQPSSDYNVNTRLSLHVFSNSVTGKFIYLELSDDQDLKMFDACKIYSNIVTTDYGLIHLGKKINNSTVTIQTSELTRNLFKVYNNLDGILYSTYEWVANDDSMVMDGVSVTAWQEKSKNTSLDFVFSNTLARKSTGTLYKPYGIQMRCPNLFWTPKRTFFMVYSWPNTVPLNIPIVMTRAAAVSPTPNFGLYRDNLVHWYTPILTAIYTRETPSTDTSIQKKYIVGLSYDQSVNPPNITFINSTTIIEHGTSSTAKHIQINADNTTTTSQITRINTIYDSGLSTTNTNALNSIQLFCRWTSDSNANTEANLHYFGIWENEIMNTDKLLNIYFTLRSKYSVPY
jgi:hypothetical protein